MGNCAPAFSRRRKPTCEQYYALMREVGFINPVSEPFCAQCDRIRLTADGQLRTCLFATEETDLRAVLRSDATDETLAEVIRQAVWHKELKHYIGDKRFKRANRSMSMIGG